jgi:hypothetical protein
MYEVECAGTARQCGDLVQSVKSHLLCHTLCDVRFSRHHTIELEARAEHTEDSRSSESQDSINASLPGDSDPPILPKTGLHAFLISFAQEPTR